MKLINKVLLVVATIGVLLSLFCITIIACSKEDKEPEPSNIKVVWNNTKDINGKEHKYNVVFSKASRNKDESPNKEIPNVKTDENGIIITDDKDLVNYADIVIKTHSTLNKDYVDYVIPPDSEVSKRNAKTYMKYQTLGYSDWNRQGHLARQKEAYTGKYNLRMLDGRVLIALGKYFTTTIGTYIDVILEDGTIIPAMLGDCKASKDTDSNGIYQKYDKSIVEFIIDSPGVNRGDYSLFKSKYPYINGNFSNTKEFKSKVVGIRVYNKVYNIDMNDMSNDNPDGR